MAFDTIIGTIIASANEAAKQFAEAMRKEYERGVADGKRQAADELRARVVSVLGVEAVSSIGVQPAPAKLEVTTNPPAVVHRAPRGSVEPAVMGAIAESIKGKKAAEIAAETGVPENSVRGMLNKLRKENRVFKVGEVWRPTGPIREPDGSFVRVTPEGHIVSVPASLAKNGNPGAPAPGPINETT
jgi:hypothetical protein